MTQMNAVRFHRTGGPEVLSLDRVDKPVPGPREALLRIEATGMNFADVVRRNGDPYPMPSPLPYTLGGECVGVVQALGPGGDAELLGQRVFGFPGSGCYAEFVCAPLDRLFPVPEHMASPQAVSLFVQGLSASLILKDAARLQPGETVFVQGAAGGVGLLAVQLAKAYAAGMVIGAASTADKRHLVLDHGADLAVDYTRAGWTDEVMQATGGRGVDVVLEMTGGQIARDCLNILAPFSRTVVYGVASRERLMVDTETLPPGNRSFRGFFLRPYLARRDMILATLDEFARLVASGRLRPHVGGTFPLSQAAQAHALLEGRQTTGKLVLVPDAVIHESAA